MANEAENIAQTIDADETVNEPEEATQEEEVELEEVDEEVVDDEQETIEDLRKKLATVQAQKEHYRKKANTVKDVEDTEKVTTNSSLSSADLLAVVKANVHEDDMERVERFATSEGLSIKEALKNPELKAILNIREEQRTTASATNVTNVRRGSTKITDDVLISKAEKGDLPDDDEGIARLVSAKLKRK